MERNFQNENVEEFLRQNTDGLRMRPSAKVWKGISNHLTIRRRKLGFILGTSLLLTTALSFILVSESANNYSTSNASPATKSGKASKAISIPQLNNKVIGEKKSVKIYPDKNKSAINLHEIFTDHPVAEHKLGFTQNPFLPGEDLTPNNFEPTIVDSYLNDENHSEKTSDNSIQRTVFDPLSIESVLNTFKPQAKRLGWQFYFAPTLSYRNVNDNKINDIVAHKPAFGFELGTAAKYPLSKKTKLRAGLQFNVNRYEIKTWDSYAQFATIKLVDGDKIGYVTKITNYNNLSGYQTNWLQNFFLQVSTPVGVEVKLAGDDKVQFGMASTVQPTYLLGDKAYLISSDYRNYIEEPNLVRRWNVNTSLETFVAYSTGRLNWQVGPQMRYQILSSYLKKYPVKEHLFDFGFKIGISANK
jgi:hypothetical protein